MEQDNYLPLSWLSQYYYCPRRAGLLMLEQVWEENEFTAAGKAGHQRVHDARIERRGKFVKLYEYAVSSNALMLSGICDCIEATEDERGCLLPFSSSKCLLYPVEHKHGVVRNEKEYKVQLCAQAMCLEEMYNCRITVGALFFTDAHRRDEISFTEELRELVVRGAKALNHMLCSQRVPLANNGPRCNKCSLKEYCQPKLKASAKAYCEKVKDAALEIEGGLT